jgi:hypothetical protein
MSVPPHNYPGAAARFYRWGDSRAVILQERCLVQHLISILDQIIVLLKFKLKLGVVVVIDDLEQGGDL